MSTYLSHAILFAFPTILPNCPYCYVYVVGGASVVYADTLSDLGMAEEVSNYGEYSGDPTESLTFEYAKTILSLMTKGQPAKGGKASDLFGSGL